MRLLLCVSTLAALASDAWAQVDPVGFYTDKPSYTPSEKVQIHANWKTNGGPGQFKYYLHRIGRDAMGKWQTNLMSTPVVEYPSNPMGIPFVRYGSFVNVPGVDLDNLTSFTLRAYIRPTLVDDGLVTSEKGVDETGIAGQLWLDTALKRRGTGFGITGEGRVFARVETDSDHTGMYPGVEIQTADPIPGPDPITGAPPPWLRIEMTYDGSELTLQVQPDGGSVLPCLDGNCTQPITGPVWVPNGTRFRIGARKEAPGDRTGCYSGRLDDVSLVGSLLDDGSRVDGPTPIGPNFTFTFEDGYGTDVFDSSGHEHNGKIIGHGTPGLEGRNGTQGLRLNHDQVFNAQFDANVVELDLATAPGYPLPSGLYVIEAVRGVGGVFTPHLDLPCAPACTPALIANRWQCIVIRPDSGSTARVAAIVPVNTWMAYDYWPSDGSTGPTGLTKRRLMGSVPGNNSAYSLMGDGNSSNHYLGWLRPCPPASPFVGAIQSTEEVFSVHAPGATKFFEWLDEFSHQVMFNGYDVFTDWDLDADAVTCPIKRGPYDLVFTLGHHEYWSRNMIDRLNDFAVAGGSLINVGGNVFGYRAERSGNALESRPGQYDSRDTGCKASAMRRASSQRRTRRAIGRASGAC